MHSSLERSCSGIFIFSTQKSDSCGSCIQRQAGLTLAACLVRLHSAECCNRGAGPDMPRLGCGAAELACTLAPGTAALQSIPLLMPFAIAGVRSQRAHTCHKHRHKLLTLLPESVTACYATAARQQQSQHQHQPLQAHPQAWRPARSARCTGGTCGWRHRDRTNTSVSCACTVAGPAANLTSPRAVASMQAAQVAAASTRQSHHCMQLR